VQRIYVTIRPLNREDSVLYFPPEAFGPFRVLHQIGAGTLGPVFRAYEPGGNRDRLVAVKVFRLDLTPDQTSVLVAELKSLVDRNLSHPAISAPIAAGLEHGAAYLAQEYAVGDSLDVVLREHGPLLIDEGVALVDALAGAIDYAAGHGVRHGSLHLRDILLDNGSARITGFGIAAALAKVGAKRPTRPQYSSPDGTSDIYSLGAIAFEAIAGKRVSPDNLVDFEERHGVELRSAFSLALALKPEMRPDRAGDFASVLRDAAEMTKETESSPAPAPSVAIATTDGLDAIDSPVDQVDFDVHIDRPPAVEGEPADNPADRLVTVASFAPPVQSWSAPPQPLSSVDTAEETPGRRWPIVAVLAAFGVLAVLSIGFFLRSPRPAATTGPDNAVDETTVDVSAGKPAASAPPAAAPAPPVATKPRQQPRAQSAAAPAPSTPAPAPSRPASGAVRGAQSGSMLIRSTPADADVTVNGRARGKTPLALRELALGSYTIRVARDGYASEERSIQLTSRRPSLSTTINLRSVTASDSSRGAVPQRTGAAAVPSGPVAVTDAAVKSGPGGLNVQSRPAGARVYVNDRLAGTTPVAIPNVPSGGVNVRIEMDGYEPWMTKVRVSPGDQLRVAASLERR
jgi:serine/threonine protein kinase